MSERSVYKIVGGEEDVRGIAKALSQTEWVNNIPSPLTGEG